MERQIIIKDNEILTAVNLNGELYAKKISLNDITEKNKKRLIPMFIVLLKGGLGLLHKKGLINSTYFETADFDEEVKDDLCRYLSHIGPQVDGAKFKNQEMIKINIEGRIAYAEKISDKIVYHIFSPMNLNRKELLILEKDIDKGE